MPELTRNDSHFSFTAASLRPELCALVAECRLRLEDWQAAKSAVLSKNILQCRSAASGVRLERELRQRLQYLTPDQLQVLATSHSEDRAHMAWLAAVKRYRFLLDFAASVLRAKLEIHDPILRASEYNAYMGSQIATLPGLGKLKPSSLTKIRTVMLLMLREAGLLLPGEDLGCIKRPLLSPQLVTTLRAEHPTFLAAFLVPDSEISSPK